MSNIGILGAGTFGMSLARMLANEGHMVTVWSAHPAGIDAILATGRQKNLPNMEIPESIRFTKEIEVACEDQDVIMFAVPSVYVRETAVKAKPYIQDGQIIVDVAKGIEPDSLLTMTEVIKDVLNSGDDANVGPANEGAGANIGSAAVRSYKNVKYVALSGPTHAEEVSRDIPSTIVSACSDPVAAEIVQDIFMNTCMRVYTNSDVFGVELCGAMKNIIALASGICEGLGYGDNSRAALITRGIAEMKRLGKAMGCMGETFDGLAGIGDLIVTCTSHHSRNFRAGVLIGQGKSAEDAKQAVGMVVEGINAIPAALELAEKYDVELPIIFAVDAVVNHGADARDAVLGLMVREKKSEHTK